jgi:hypothetical protein
VAVLVQPAPGVVRGPFASPDHGQLHQR